MGQKNIRQEKLRKAMRCFVTTLPTEDTGKIFSKSELIQDLNFMLKTMEDVHPNLYFYCTKEKAKSLLRKIENSLHEDYDRIKFYTQIAGFVANFHDGHTSVNIPNEEYFEYKNSDGLFFPFDVDCSSGKILVLNSHSEEIHSHQGATIKSINGISAEEILNSMIALRGCERREMSLKMLSASFRKLMFLLHGETSGFTVSLSNNGDMIEYVIPGVSFKVIERGREQKQNNQEAPYSFVINKEKGYTFLDFREFINPKSFEEFISGMFKEIESEGVTKLIVDLRKNGGGNSSLTEEFVSYITDKPFRQFSRADLKVSKLIRKYYSVMMKYLSPFPLNLLPAIFTFSAPWQKKIGEVVSHEMKPALLKPKQPHFTGSIIVLTGSYTFSSAIGFASAIKDNDLGIIVGNPTGGFPSTHGDSFPFSLPNTCLQCAVSHKFFVRPSGNENPEPLYPDYLVEESFPGSKTDEVLVPRHDIIVG